MYSLHCKSIEKNADEVTEYGGKIWINQGHLQKKLDIANIAERTQCYSFKISKSEMRNTRVWSISTLHNVH